MRMVSLLLAVLLLPAAPLRAADTLKVGLAAMISPRETVRFYGQMLDYLAGKLGRPVEMVQRENYDEMDRLLERGDVQIAFICSGPYVKDRAKFGVELLVAPQSYGAPVYYAYILVPRDSPYKSLEDLRGKKFAFADPKSNTGCLVPTYMIAKQFNSRPEQFFGPGNIIYTRSHDKSIEAVGKRIVDGSSVDSLIYDYITRKAPERVAGTRILVKSPPFGIPPVVVRPDFDPALRERIKGILLGMHEEPAGRDILDGIMVDKFVVPRDRDYDSVREMEDFVGRMK